MRKMKWSEAVFRALGEIDDDLIPAEEAGGNGRSGRRQALTAFGTAAAAILLLVGWIVLFPRLSGQNETLPTETPPAGSGISAMENRRDYLPYLSSFADDLIPAARFLTIPALPSPEDGPQIFSADDPADISLSGLTAFTDRDGAVRQVVGGSFETEDALMKNLRRDAAYANFTRSYGCVLWQTDWTRTPAEAEYVGVVPLLKPEETEARLLAGEYVTSIPAGDAPALTETDIGQRIGRRTLVYLLSPAEDRIRLYECFFVRMDAEENAVPRWGLFYVPAAEVPADD